MPSIIPQENEQVRASEKLPVRAKAQQLVTQFYTPQLLSRCAHCQETIGQPNTQLQSIGGDLFATQWRTFLEDTVALAISYWLPIPCEKWNDHQAKCPWRQGFPASSPICVLHLSSVQPLYHIPLVNSLRFAFLLCTLPLCVHGTVQLSEKREILIKKKSCQVYCIKVYIQNINIALFKSIFIMFIIKSKVKACYVCIKWIFCLKVFFFAYFLAKFLWIF